MWYVRALTWPRLACTTAMSPSVTFRKDMLRPVSANACSVIFLRQVAWPSELLRCVVLRWNKRILLLLQLEVIIFIEESSLREQSYHLSDREKNGGEKKRGEEENWELRWSEECICSYNAFVLLGSVTMLHFPWTNTACFPQGNSIQWPAIEVLPPTEHFLGSRYLRLLQLTWRQNSLLINLK